MAEDTTASCDARARTAPRAPSRPGCTRLRPAGWLLVAVAALGLLAPVALPVAAASAAALATPGPVVSQGSGVLAPDDAGDDRGTTTTPPATSTPAPAATTPGRPRPDAVAPPPGSGLVAPGPRPRASTGQGPTRGPGLPSLVGLTVSEARRLLVRAGLPVEGLTRLPDRAVITAQRLDPRGEVVVEVARQPGMGPAPDQGSQGPDGADPPPTSIDGAPLRPAVRPTVEEMLEECRRLDRHLEQALLLVEPEMQMRVDDATTVPAEVTLDVDGPARRVTASGADGVDVLVSCQLRAHLTGADEDFDVEPDDWQERSLLTKRTAEWSWSVTPRRAGQADLRLMLEPIVIVDDQRDGGGATPVSMAGSTEVVVISVDVSAPVDVVLSSWMDRAGAFLTSLKGMLLAAAAVVAAALALWAGVRHRHRAAGSTAEVTGPPAG